MTRFNTLLWACLLSCALPAAAQEEGFLPADWQRSDDGAPLQWCASSQCCDSESCTAPCSDFQCWPEAPGWFVGLGASYNTVRVDSDISGSGVTNIYDSTDTLVAIGFAGGPAPPYHLTQSTFAPVAQIGFAHNLLDTEWIWGTKFTYKYLGLTFNRDNFDAAQYGVYEILNPPSLETLTGNATAESVQVIVNHELALFPFVGRAFRKGHFYAGGGPVVFDTKSRMYTLRSFADINGVHTNVGGNPVNLAGQDWIWGGGCQIGMIYNISPNCFFDFSYDFVVTGRDYRTYPVSVTSESNGLTYDTNITYREFVRVWAQSFSVAFNLKF